MWRKSKGSDDDSRDERMPGERGDGGGKKGVLPERGGEGTWSGLGNPLHHLTALASADARTSVGCAWVRYWFKGQLKWEAGLGNRRVYIPGRELWGML